MNVYEYGEGWIYFGLCAFQWVTSSRSKPCYIVPYSPTNVPVGIDGLEFA